MICSFSAPNVFHSVTGSATDVTYRGLRLNAEIYDNVTPKNTDGFDVGASYVTISNVTVNNQDDCVSFKPNANSVTVTNITCTGSHGLSVGSLAKGSNDIVSGRLPGRSHIDRATGRFNISMLIEQP